MRLSVAERWGLVSLPQWGKVAALPTDEVFVQKNFERLRSKPTTHPP